MTTPLVRPVGQGARVRDFWNAARVVYAGDPCWVPPLPGFQARAFDARFNPTLAGGRGARWVALRDGNPVGRIAAFAPAHRPGVGYFGFFESLDDPALAAALLREAEAWLAAHGCHEVFGPVSVTPRDQVGVLVDGFDQPPVLLTPYNPRFYPLLLLGAGYTPAVPLRAYGWDRTWRDPRDLTRLAATGTGRSRIRIRPINPHRLREETRTIASLVNETLAESWHYDPITAPEADQLARDLRLVLDPALTLIAEDEDGPCGVALAVPDLNWLWREAGGRLWPLGWWRFLALRHAVPRLRGMALGVARRVRGSTTTGRLIAAWLAAGVARGYQSAELAQVFDHNGGMRRILDRLGLPVVRRYAVYHRSLNP